MEERFEKLLEFFEIVNESKSNDRNRLVSGISARDVFELEQFSLQQINEGFNANIMALIVHAQMLVNTYNTLNIVLNGERENTSQKNYYYPVVNIRKGSTFSIEWYKSNYFTNPKNGSHFYRPERVVKSEKYKGYNSRHFAKAPDWAKNNILEFEEQFQKIREQYEAIKSLKRSLLKSVRLHNEKLSENQSKDEENPLEHFKFQDIKEPEISVS